MCVSKFLAAHCFPRLKGRAAHTDTVGQHSWRQHWRRLSKYGQNLKWYLLQPVPCGVCVWVYLCPRIFSGEQQVLTGPPSSLAPPTNPVFCVCACACVCQQAWSAQCGSDVKVIDRRAVTKAIESSCGKRGTLQPHRFQPWGGERERET